MHYPRARAWWMRWRQGQCSVCGLKFPCPDARMRRVQARFAVNPQNLAPVRDEWSQPQPQIGRAGSLTPGQAKRANWRRA